MSSKVKQLKNTSNNNGAKKLTLSNLNKLASQFNEKRKITILVNGEEFEVMIHNKFRETAVRKVCVDYIKILYELKQLNNLDDEAILNATYLLNTLVLKEFTNLPIPDVVNKGNVTVEDLEKLIKVTENLVDLGIIEYLLGENSPFGKENIELLNRVANQVSANVGKTISELGLISELSGLERNKIDVDDYFAELEKRNFEVSEDEDLSLLLQVIDQLNEDGKYEEYMSKLSADELDKLNERMKMLNKQQSGEENGEV